MRKIKTPTIELFYRQLIESSADGDFLDTSEILRRIQSWTWITGLLSEICKLEITYSHSNSGVQFHNLPGHLV